ncbi:Uncharacterised protein [Neisseria meningitidis]|nr:Uncharacterised protein [Neisseria meningitidis]
MMNSNKKYEYHHSQIQNLNATVLSEATKTLGIYQKKQKPPPPSFPRRRESGNPMLQELIRNN